MREVVDERVGGRGLGAGEGCDFWEVKGVKASNSSSELSSSEE